MILLMTVPALAGTRDDCISKCKEAGNFIKTKGIAAAIKEIGNKKGAFVWNDGVQLCILDEYESQMLAHPTNRS